MPVNHVAVGQQCNIGNINFRIDINVGSSNSSSSRNKNRNNNSKLFRNDEHVF